MCIPSLEIQTYSSGRKNQTSKRYLHLFFIYVFVLLYSLSYSQGCAINQYEYEPENLCINCPLACKTCQDSFKCTDCYSTATTVSTLISQKCYCQNGKYYNPKTLVCDSCDKVILNCDKCSIGLSSSTCLACDNGFYLHSATSCAACPPKCRTCLNSTQCLTCIYGEYVVVNGECVCNTKCSTCLSIDPNCIDCGGKNCNKCGVGYRQKDKKCIACITGCLRCRSNDCNICFAGYFRDDNNQCQSCSTFHPKCAECEQTQCTMCVSGYRLDMKTHVCVPNVVNTCDSTQIIIDTKCIDCFIIFDPQCKTCDDSECISCHSGYQIDNRTNTCMKIPICGDGDWVIGFQNCDDRNNLDGDGCSADCQVQTDYDCHQIKKPQTVESLCKYTKDFAVNLMYIHKEESQNVAFLYFNFEESTFQLWTESELKKFLTPVLIIDTNTGTGNTISYKSLEISFGIVNSQIKFIIKIDYGQQNIENNFIKFAMDSSQTALSQINTKSIQPSVFLLIDSRNNGVNLYSYGPDIYETQKLVYTLSTVLGYTSFAFLILGLISPVGKLIVIEALAVIQLGFFTVLQFRKIPPTFIGLKNLMTSNGFNDLDLIASVEGQHEQIIYHTMGLNPNIFANYNLGFLALFISPLFVGLIGFIISKFTLTKLPKFQDTKENLLNDVEKKRFKDIDTNNRFTDDLRDTVFKRIIFEFSFFGLITSGYLAWISAFNSLKSPDGVTIFGFLFLLVIWIVYGILYLKVHTQQLYLPQHYLSTYHPQNTFILKGFGDFRDVYQQISKNNFYYGYTVQKVYIAFILERFIISILIVYVSNLFAYTSFIIALVFIVFLIVLILSYIKYQKKKKAASESISLFSYLHRNYVLRQSFNFITTIIVQLIYLVQAMKMQDTGSYVDTLSTNSLTTKLVPILILSFLYMNFVINVFLWIWQLKSSQIVRKTLQMKKFFFSQKDLKPYRYNLEQKKKKEIHNSSFNQKQNNQNKKRSIQDQDKAIQKTMRKQAQKTNKLHSRKSPFLGYTQSNLKLKTLEIQSLQNESARKLNIQMPSVTIQNQNKMFLPQDAV